MALKFIKSPLSESHQAVMQQRIQVDDLIERYKRELDIDVSRLLNEHEIFIYQCEDSKYRFFYPFNISGDSKFYEQLESFDWYYMPWKWEHEKIRKLLNGDEKILEIGSGGLGFLSKMTHLGYDITGLELNENSVRKAKNLKLKLYNETIQDYSLSNENKFDVVCSFQVLEHISKVRTFINSQVDCLKPGGKLIISVPNNNSFIKYSEGGILNKPPHHMGLWNEDSLRSIAKIFNLSVEKVFYEPLQKYHFDWYINTVMLPRLNKYKITRKIYSSFGNKRFLEYILQYFNKFIKGHSIIIIYKKIA